DAPLAIAHLYRDADVIRHTSLAALLEQWSAARPPQSQLPFSSDVDKHQYLACLDRIVEYLRAGDCYQVNYARRFSSAYAGVPLFDWARLASQHPAPHASFFSI